MCPASMKMRFDNFAESSTVWKNKNILKILFEILAQTDKTDDNRYDLEAKNVKMTKEIVELRKRVQEVKGNQKRILLCYTYFF